MPMERERQRQRRPRGITKPARPARITCLPKISFTGCRIRAPSFGIRDKGKMLYSCCQRKKTFEKRVMFC